MTPSTISPESSDAIASALASTLSLRLRMLDQRLSSANIARLADEAIVASTSLESLVAEVAARFLEITAGKIGVNLANTVRISEEALDSDDGSRRWLGAAHKTNLARFHKTIIDHHHGKADTLDLFLAQLALAGSARARGILGIPVPAHKLREVRNVRAFTSDDYVDQDVRAAIVRAAFEANEDSIALLRSKAGTLPYDNDGQITLILSAIDGDDVTMRESLGALAGMIVARDRNRITLNIGGRGEAWARQLSSTLRRRHPAAGWTNSSLQ